MLDKRIKEVERINTLIINDLTTVTDIEEHICNKLRRMPSFYKPRIYNGSNHRYICKDIRGVRYFTWNTMPLISPMKSCGNKSTFQEHFATSSFEDLVKYKAYITARIVLNNVTDNCCVALSEVDEYVANYVRLILVRLYENSSHDYVPQFKSETDEKVYSLGYYTFTNIHGKKLTSVNKLNFVVPRRRLYHKLVNDVIGTRAVYYQELNLYNVHLDASYALEDFKAELSKLRPSRYMFLGDFNVTIPMMEGVMVHGHIGVNYILEVLAL